MEDTGLLLYSTKFKATKNKTYIIASNKSSIWRKFSLSKSELKMSQRPKCIRKKNIAIPRITPCLLKLSNLQAHRKISDIM